MNRIGAGQCDDILDSFMADSTGLTETSNVRARERRDSHIFYFRDWYNIMTARGLREGRCFRIYENSFSRKLSKFDEPGRVSLCALPRLDALELYQAHLEIALRKEYDPQKIQMLNECLEHTRKWIKKMKAIEEKRKSDKGFNV